MTEFAKLNYGLLHVLLALLLLFLWFHSFGERVLFLFLFSFSFSLELLNYYNNSASSFYTYIVYHMTHLGYFKDVLSTLKETAIKMCMCFALLFVYFTVLKYSSFAKYIK